MTMPVYIATFPQVFNKPPPPRIAYATTFVTRPAKIGNVGTNYTALHITNYILALGSQIYILLLAL